MDTLNVIALAEAHGWRVRNLHDGYPCPPTRRRGERRSKGYRAEPQVAIIGKAGYIDVADGRLCWTLLLATRRRLRNRLIALSAAGLTAVACGDTEAWGYFSLDQLETVANVIEPFRSRARITGTPAGEALRRAESTQSAGAVPL